MTPILALFNFTVRQTLLHRRIWLTLVMLVAPSVLHLAIRAFAPPLEDPRDVWEVYHISALFLFMSVLIPLVCLVHGTALIGADVEAGTIAYLITRRLRRATVLLVKFVATLVVLAGLCDLAMVGLHLSQLAGRDLAPSVANSSYADWSPAHDLRAYLIIIPFAVSGFLALFNFIALLTARPIAASVIYLVVSELVLSNIPAKARVYSLSHWLRVPLSGMIPGLPRVFEIPRDLTEKLYPPGAGLPAALVGIPLVALALAAIIVSVRELMPDKAARE
jgi:hypothetical protein